MGFIREVHYPKWLSSVVLVKKANGKGRMCVHFTNLNKACPKDSFPLSRIDVIVDATAGHQFLSFMDTYSGYNQIRMNKADEEKTTFITDKGLYCYRVMPFGLKNVGATYQRMLNRMFKHQIGKSIERGIEANTEKIEAILRMAAPRTINNTQRLAERIAALNKALGVRQVEVTANSQIVVNHVTETYTINEEKLKKYLEQVLVLHDQFEHFTIMHIPRTNNSVVDRLAKATLTRDEAELPWEVQRRLIEMPAIEISIEQVRLGTPEWAKEIEEFLDMEKLSMGKEMAMKIKKKAT
ncbi:uncharacterized protein LOC121260932 [Juglans microcarpa x Juglans regia]|uniref:uncharacterized protein LOC121260932 n=1 Tax=Juglans microcarpa x Juglans regia TaxID=2249226 RepID=UPI001B7DD273|nr:uncharacterized protein LOC121260932 [Juglans microcarpa x Juglans regia]